MFGDFFKYWDELPEDGGFTLFDITHIGWILFLALGIGIAVHFIKEECADTGCYFKNTYIDNSGTGDFERHLFNLCRAYGNPVSSAGNVRSGNLCRIGICIWAF